MSSWHQSHVRNGHAGTGHWAIRVARAGEYEFVLRRWPEHVDEPIEATEARIRIAGVDLRQEVEKDAKKAVFKARLPSGRTRLETWFTLPDGETRGAYFVYVRRVGS